MSCVMVRDRPQNLNFYHAAGAANIVLRIDPSSLSTYTTRANGLNPWLCDAAGIPYVSPEQRELELMTYRALVSDGRFRRSATISA